MDQFPKDALRFQDKFSTEEQCKAALFKLRWPKGFICPNCEHDDGGKIETRGLIQCRLCGPSDLGHRRNHLPQDSLTAPCLVLESYIKCHKTKAEPRQPALLLN